MNIYHMRLDAVSTIIFMSEESQDIKLIKHGSTIAISRQSDDVSYIYDEVYDMSNEEEYDDYDLHIALEDFNSWSYNLDDVNIAGRDYCFNPDYVLTQEQINSILAEHEERVKL